MILNKNRFFVFILIVLVGSVITSCVDIPANAPTLPTYQSSYRFISVNPSSFATPTEIKIAEGPDFKTFKTVTIGANATETVFQTFDAGTKHIIYNNGIQDDTLSVTFEADQRGNLAFARNQRPTADTSNLVDVYKFPIRYTFGTNGIVDTTVVNVTNLVLFHYATTAGVFSADTIDVCRDSVNGKGGVLADNVGYGKTSTFKIPTGKTYTLYFTDSKDNKKIYADSLVISGASKKTFSVFVYDYFDSLATPANANVKIKMIEDF